VQTPAPFEITAADDGSGARSAHNGQHAMHLLEGDGRLFRRRAVKGLGSEQPAVVEWIVAELAGVRVYYDGLQVVVTRRDITP
jgi:hypothetical protein